MEEGVGSRDMNRMRMRMKIRRNSRRNDEQDEDGESTGQRFLALLSAPLGISGASVSWAPRGRGPLGADRGSIGCVLGASRW
eukprot:4545250-Pyramimonas_sp.AAC.1